jgi:bacteriocin biosynthesis cyclodehydratase domain-containing protein
MATAVHLTSETASPASVTAAALGVGPFGRRVAGALVADLPVARRARDLEDAFDAGPAVVVAALWRPSPALCEQADMLAFAHRVAWLPVVAEHPVVRIGPLIRPPSAPCYRCCRTRQAQHDRQPGPSAVLEDAYDREPLCGPAGFLPQHARTVAAVARRLLYDGLAGAGPAGLTVTLSGPALWADRVIAVHGCPRCGRELASSHRTAGPLTAALSRETS